MDHPTGPPAHDERGARPPAQPLDRAANGASCHTPLPCLCDGANLGKVEIVGPDAVQAWIWNVIFSIQASPEWGPHRERRSVRTGRAVASCEAAVGLMKSTQQASGDSGALSGYGANVRTGVGPHRPAHACRGST